MKVLYVSSVDSSCEAGYFHAVMKRISKLQEVKNQKFIFKTINFDRKRGRIPYITNNYWFPRIFNTKIFFYIFTEFYLFFIILFNCLRFKPDIIHVHWAYPVGYACSVVSKLLNIKLIVHCHGSDVHTNPKNSKRVYLKTEKCFERADQILVVSNGLKRKLLRIFPSVNSEKLRVSYNIIDLEGVKRKRVNNEICKVLFLGNLEIIKGADRLPSIFEGLSVKAHRQIDFHIIGEGGLKSRLKHSLSKYDVTFHGRLPRKEALEELSESTVLVMPSRDEGFGMVAAESLILGIPCVAYNIEGVRDVFQYNQEFLVTIGCESEFVDRVIKVIINRGDYASNLKLKELFSPDKIIHEEIECYENIVFG